VTNPAPNRLQQHFVLASLIDVVAAALAIPNWWRKENAQEICRLSYLLPENAVIVEIGSFLGAGTILLAGPRKLRRSGTVFSVDPFDCSGDSFSVPYYKSIVAQLGGGNPREYFEANLQRLNLRDCVEVCQGRATEIAQGWNLPVDFLVMDGDQSPKGVEQAYQSWIPFLRPGGFIAAHNSAPGDYGPDHDGHRLLASRSLMAPKFANVRLIGETTLARCA
jgi:MMP 1-O-methyltransferase